MRMLLFLVTLLFAPASAAENLADLAWLKGCWRTHGGGPVVTEVWMTPPMPSMVGYSYTTGEGGVQGWEQMRIDMIDGQPHFVAMPAGGAPVRFRLREVSMLAGGPEHGVGATFENGAHDYPQLITYLRVGAALTATISTLDGGDPVHFRYRRVRCGANLRP